MWTNQNVPPSYRPAAPTADNTTVSTDPTGSNEGSTARPGRPPPVQAKGPASSAAMVATNHAPASTDPGPIGRGHR
jgi:hypothetical protein